MWLAGKSQRWGLERPLIFHFLLKVHLIIISIDAILNISDHQLNNDIGYFILKILFLFGNRKYANF